MSGSRSLNSSAARELRKAFCPGINVHVGDLSTEYRLFEGVLPQLLHDHRGEFVLFRDGNVVAFYGSYHDAYVAGLETFGIDGQFLIGEIKDHEPTPVSMSWQSGVMFDPK